MMLIFSFEWVDKLLINFMPVFVDQSEKVFNRNSVDNLILH